MSRATNIWIVHNAFGEQQAAFTVKHEMITWLESVHIDGWVVVRLRDGRSYDQYPPAAFNVAELLPTTALR